MKTSRELVVLPSRREFCAHSCRIAAVVAASVAAACGGSPTSPSSAPAAPAVNGTVTGRVVSVPIDGASPLAAVGSAAVVNSSLGSFLASRTTQESFSVLTATCTHEQCTVTGFSSGRYVCPCHGSQYSTEGSVLQGPATRALQTFPSQFANNVLTFTA